MGRFVYEPAAAVLAADLTGSVAQALGLAPIAFGSAYLTGERRLGDALLAMFEVIEVLPFNVRRLKKLLRERRIGRLEVKQRGAGSIRPRSAGSWPGRGTSRPRCSWLAASTECRRSWPGVRRRRRNRPDGRATAAARFFHGAWAGFAGPVPCSRPPAVWRRRLSGARRALAVGVLAAGGLAWAAPVAGWAGVAAAALAAGEAGLRAVATSTDRSSVPR